MSAATATRSVAPAHAASPAKPIIAAPAARSGVDWTLVTMFVFFSLQAATIIGAFEVFTWLKEPKLVMIVALGSLAAIFGIALYTFKKLGYALSAEGCFFVIVLWSAICDLILAFCSLGWTNLGYFYYVHGEEYFKTSWGFWALLWDGTFHYALQFYLAYATFKGGPRAVAGLVWSGSVINSMPVLLGGAATGMYSHTIKPATGINAPYIVLPIWIAFVMFKDGYKEVAATATGSPAAGRRSPTGPSTSRMMVWCGDVAWGAFHAAAIVVHIWRAVVTLGSAHPLAEQWKAGVEPYLVEGQRLQSHGFLNVQLLTYAFYYVPFHAWALYHSLCSAMASEPLSRATRDTLAVWSMFMAGGYLQGQGGFMTAVVWEWVGFGPLAWNPPQSETFWNLQCALLVLPCAHAAWCWHTNRMDN